jgi:ribosomal protein S18 acetylase RimI-like enzyme
VTVEITRASPDRLTLLASLLGRSFVVEPMLRWSLGDHDDIPERFTSYFARALERLVPAGMVWEAESADGAAVWIPPDGTEDWQVMHTRDPWIEELTLDGGRRYSAFWDWVESRMPEEPLWHLNAIAVEPVARGRGIGSALIEHGLALARADRSGAFLETGNPRNVAYYETFGFRVVDESEAPEGGPRVWIMRRDA